jgi:hypothetical protein
MIVSIAGGILFGSEKITRQEEIKIVEENI